MFRFSQVAVPAIRYLCEVERLCNIGLQRLGYKRRSFSQKGQDRWIIDKIFPAYIGGYFVELGGGDGCTHSNTYVLERDFEWSGIIIEANPRYAEAIRKIRCCDCVNVCVDGVIGEVNFLPFGYLGGIIAEDTDHSPAMRPAIIGRQKAVRMRAATLETVLDNLGAPRTIDYLSIDIEGAEYRVLKHFPFDRYEFSAMTIERPSLELHAILNDNGYVLARTKFFDGFYLSAAMALKHGVRALPFTNMGRKNF